MTFSAGPAWYYSDNMNSSQRISGENTEQAEIQLSDSFGLFHIHVDP